MKLQVGKTYRAMTEGWGDYNNGREFPFNFIILEKTARKDCYRLKAFHSLFGCEDGMEYEQERKMIVAGIERYNKLSKLEKALE